MISFSSLDLLWKLLMIVAVSSAIIFGSFLLAQVFLRKQAGHIYNRLAQVSSLSILGIFAVGGTFLFFLDREINEQCFCNFADANGTFGITRVLALLWVSGFMLFLLRDFYLYFRFKRIVVSKTIQKTSEYIEVESGLAPLSFGLWSQQIVIPQSLSGNDVVLKHILGHERIHLKNRDGVWSLLALVVQRLAWFNPLSYLFEQGRNLAMEMATDEEAIQDFSFSRQEYGDSLIAVLESIRSFESDRMSAAAVLRFSDLKLRLENLNSTSQRTERSYRKWLALAVMLGGWVWGTNQSFASLRMSNSGGQVLMCYQVQQEKIIEEWLNMKTEANKCE